MFNMFIKMYPFVFPSKGKQIYKILNFSKLLIIIVTFKYLI